MSQVWGPTAVSTVRATLQSSRSRTAPLLQLFNGFARCRGIAHCRSSRPVVASPYSWPFKESRHLSNTARYALRVSSQRHAASEDANTSPHAGSKLEAAQTVASHTEGVADDATTEELTWRDYDPVGGMPLPDGERSQAEINAIFGGESVDVDTGNYILSVMHWRRQSGALIDAGITFPDDSGVTKEQAMAGLDYVRTLVPDLDEQAAGQRYVDEEAERLRTEIRDRAVRLGIYKPEQEEQEAAEAEETLQGTEEGRERTGQSALLKLREANERAFEQEEAQKARAAYQAQMAMVAAVRGPLELLGGIQPSLPQDVNLSVNSAGGISISRPATEGWLQPVERKPWVKYYEDQATLIKENAVPQLSNLRRLGPSFMLLLVTLAGCYYFGTTYTPPPQSARMFPDTPPSLVTIGTVSAILAASFLANRFPPMWRTYSKYFCITPGYPNTWSLLGASWRHDTLVHLLTNVGMLWGFGTLLHEDIGRGGFLAVYIASGAVGGFTALSYNVFRKHWMSYIYGASGNILGVAATVCILHPYGSVQVLGNEIPMSGWALLTLITGYIGFGAWSGVQAVDHAGHLGGLAAGMVMGLLARQTQVAIETSKDSEEKE